MLQHLQSCLYCLEFVVLWCTDFMFYFLILGSKNPQISLKLVEIRTDANGEVSVECPYLFYVSLNIYPQVRTRSFVFLDVLIRSISSTTNSTMNGLLGYLKGRYYHIWEFGGV